MLVGREPELREVRLLVEGLRDGRGGGLLIRGPAGIGKTALLASAREMAPEAVVLECRGVESESSLSFAALRDLTATVVGRRTSLPAPQRAALEGALTLAPPVPGDPLAVCVATLGVLEAEAAERPILALVDDVHWLDSASRDCVAFAARRVRGPIALLFAGRDSFAYDDLAGIPDTELHALDLRSSTELLARAAPDLAPEVREAIRAAAGGNPLALLELRGR